MEKYKTIRFARELIKYLKQFMPRSQGDFIAQISAGDAGITLTPLDLVIFGIDPGIYNVKKRAEKQWEICDSEGRVCINALFSQKRLAENCKRQITRNWFLEMTGATGTAFRILRADPRQNDKTDKILKREGKYLMWRIADMLLDCLVNYMIEEPENPNSLIINLVEKIIPMLDGYADLEEKPEESCSDMAGIHLQIKNGTFNATREFLEEYGVKHLSDKYHVKLHYAFTTGNELMPICALSDPEDPADNDRVIKSLADILNVGTDSDKFKQDSRLLYIPWQVAKRIKTDR